MTATRFAVYVIIISENQVKITNSILNLYSRSLVAEFNVQGIVLQYQSWTRNGGGGCGEKEDL
jgi:hypothetical protein